MKGLATYTLVAVLAASAEASSHHHHHRHIKRNTVSAVQQSQAPRVTAEVAASIDVIYQEVGANGQTTPMHADDAKKCLKDKTCSTVTEIIDGTQTPQQQQRSTTMTTTTTTKTSDVVHKSTQLPKLQPQQQDLPPELHQEVSQEPSHELSLEASQELSLEASQELSHKEPIKEPIKEPTKELPQQQQQQQQQQQGASPESPSSKSGHGHIVNGVDMTLPFPNNTISCSEIPVKYGALALDWLKNSSSWASLLRVGGYPNAEKLTVNGTCATCEPGCMCSYACPLGYGGTQWPRAQGSKNESVGGLECNAEGRLSFTNTTYSTLCRPSAADIKIINKLDGTVASCKTAYPGTEAMVIPAVADGGETIPLWIPMNNDYISPTNGTTSAQYYVNHINVTREEGCVWTSDKYPDSAGDLAPVIIGGSVDFHTLESSIAIHFNPKYKGKAPNYSIKIEGDVIGEACWYINGTYPKPDGCTATIKKGGTAAFIFYPPGA